VNVPKPDGCFYFLFGVGVTLLILLLYLLSPFDAPYVLPLVGAAWFVALVGWLVGRLFGPDQPRR
jgi:hypothetical protein